MDDLPARLRSDLTAAMRARDKAAVRVLRTVLSAIANAEAHPPGDEPSPSLRSDGVIAGATHGTGTTDVARRELDAEEVRSIVEAERAERLASADDLDTRGSPEAAGVLRDEAAFLQRYLD